MFIDIGADTSSINKGRVDESIDKRMYASVIGPTNQRSGAYVIPKTQEWVVTTTHNGVKVNDVDYEDGRFIRRNCSWFLKGTFHYKHKQKYQIEATPLTPQKWQI